MDAEDFVNNIFFLGGWVARCIGKKVCRQNNINYDDIILFSIKSIWKDCSIVGIYLDRHGFDILSGKML